MDNINVASNLTAVTDRIRVAEHQAHRTPQSVTLLAVSKTKPAALIEAASAAGQRCFGENYAQEAVEKAEALKHLNLEWHFIGPIQSNKTRGLATHMDWIHTVEREKIARRLNDQRPDDMAPLNICLQVNISGEASKAGILSTEVLTLADAISALPKLRLRGLMAIPAPSEGIDAQRRPFKALKDIWGELKGTYPELDTLSMGMSGDLEAAVLEGATIVRIGTDVFGAR
ncbi:YggS family pyridoxal phosphate-dependent enzyme [Luminiphilus sp.]|nr:YggS family pyridoxal phosphate-dependent enzyme [Luminiphilus sp.]